MEAIKSWAFSVCAAMTACGIARLVLPKGGMEKVMRATVSVFFLCCLLAPVVLRAPELRIEVQESAQEEIERKARRLTEEVASQTGAAAGEELRKIIGEKLAQMGINYRDVAINMNVSGQNAPEGVRVDILLDKAHEKDHERILRALEEAFGVEIRLEYSAEEG